MVGRVKESIKNRTDRQGCNLRAGHKAAIKLQPFTIYVNYLDCIVVLQKQSKINCTIRRKEANKEERMLTQMQ